MLLFSEFSSIEMADVATVGSEASTTKNSANERDNKQSRFSASQNCAQSHAPTSAQHVTSVKVFIAVFLLYLFSYLPSFLILFGVVDNFVFVYTYFLNHVGNPICYYVINKEFRKDVHKLFVCNSCTSRGV